MTTKLTIDSLDCTLCVNPSSHRLTYILYPMDFLEEWIEPAAKQYATSIAVITGMDWDNVFSPWPAPGEPPGSPDFRGESAQFLSTLRQSVVPAIERHPGLPAVTRRDLVGVSMSGLFALWQWMECDLFDDIASLSGSFWYPGFVDWLKGLTIPRKSGKGYFLLGNQESKSPVKAFQPVAADTAAILNLLKGAGIDVTFESVPGNHFADPLPRLDRAMTALNNF